MDYFHHFFWTIHSVLVDINVRQTSHQRVDDSQCWSSTLMILLKFSSSISKRRFYPFRVCLLSSRRENRIKLWFWLTDWLTRTQKLKSMSSFPAVGCVPTKSRTWLITVTCGSCEHILCKETTGSSKQCEIVRGGISPTSSCLGRDVGRGLEVTCWPRLDGQSRGQCGLVSGGDRRWASSHNYGLRPGLPGPWGWEPRRAPQAALHQLRWDSPRVGKATWPKSRFLRSRTWVGTRPLSDLLVSCWHGFHFQVSTSFKRSGENKRMMTQIRALLLRACLSCTNLAVFEEKFSFAAFQL